MNHTALIILIGCSITFGVLIGAIVAQKIAERWMSELLCDVRDAAMRYLGISGEEWNGMILMIAEQKEEERELERMYWR